MLSGVVESDKSLCIQVSKGKGKEKEKERRAILSFYALLNVIFFYIYIKSHCRMSAASRAEAWSFYEYGQKCEMLSIRYSNSNPEPYSE